MLTASATPLVAATTPRLGRGLLLAYALPGLPLAFLMLPVFVHLPVYYAEDLGLGFAVVGAVFLLGRIWDVVTDPIIGVLSDRIRTPLGRRRPWMLAGGPLVILATICLFMPGESVTWQSLLFWTMALYLGATLLTLPYGAWGAELSSDYHGRSRVTAWRESFMVLGVLLAAALPAVLGEGGAESLRTSAWLFILLLPIALPVTLLFVPEVPSPRRQWRGWREGAHLILANAPFRRLILAYFLNGVANGLPATLFLLFVDHGLGRADLAGAFLFAYFASGVAAVPVWLWVSRRYGKHRTWMGAMILACAVFATVPLLGQGDATWFLIICVLTGAGLGADLSLPPSMQADVIDLDTLEAGESRAGTFFALWGMATKFALALAIGLAFPLLDIAGFSADGEQSAPSLILLVVLYSLVPIGFKLAAIWLLRRYPITEAAQRDLRRRIEARQGASAAAVGR